MKAARNISRKLIAAYASDYEKLKVHSACFPSPDYLLSVTKQGATDAQPSDTPTELSQGADWIVNKASETSDQPLHVLVWRSISDVARAVHHHPSVKENL